MATGRAIGLIELSSIGVGYRAQDAMLKAAGVEVLVARTICSGKYLIIVGGPVSDVQSSVRAGLEAADEAIVDHLVLPNVHGSVPAALGQSVELAPDRIDALGVIETFGAVSVIAAADAAAKAADVTVFRIHVAMALGGKGLCLLTGPVADAQAAVSAGAAAARERGLLTCQVVIAGPSRELFGEYV